MREEDAGYSPVATEPAWASSSSFLARSIRPGCRARVVTRTPSATDGARRSAREDQTLSGEGTLHTIL